MSNKIERRFIAATNIQKRTTADNRVSGVRGYSAKFNSRSENLGGFVEEIQPGFFRQALLLQGEEGDTAHLQNHNQDLVIGRRSNGLLRLSEDSVGLDSDCDLPDTGTATEYGKHVAVGNIYQMSFAFTVNDGGEKWEYKSNTNVRTLLPDGCARLYDTSGVTYPAYPDTTASARSLFQEKRFDGLPAVMIRAAHNIPLLDDDKTLLRDAIELLKRLSDIEQKEAEDQSAQGIAIADLKAARGLRSLEELKASVAGYRK